MVWPAISRRILRGRRVEAVRAGMMATTFIVIRKAQITPEPKECQYQALALQQVDGLMHVGHAEMLGHRGITLGNLLVHRIRDVAIGEVPGGRSAELADIERFGEIH